MTDGGFEPPTLSRPDDGWGGLTDVHPLTLPFAYNESIKREVKRRPIYECRCDERLKTKAEGSNKEIFFFFVEKKKLHATFCGANVGLVRNRDATRDDQNLP